MIVVYSMALWWGFWGWYLLVRCYSAHADRLARGKQISKWHQIVQLLRLTFGRGIPPLYYYRYRLYLYPASQWWDFIYDHELPHWHRSFSTIAPGSQSQCLIADKALFAEHMKKHGIQVAETAELFKRAEWPDQHRVFSGRNLFFKPRSGSRSAGCFTLLHNKPNDSYQIRSGELQICERSEIIAYILRQVLECDYLAQPLLRNHPAVAQVLNTDLLATIRVITAMSSTGCMIVSANFEISAGNYKRWHVYPVDLASGSVRRNRFPLDQPDVVADDAVIGLSIPHWPQALALCRRAHAQCPDLLTIGWDVAINAREAILLEGNTNWGAAVHQCAHGKPLLQGPLADIYKEYESRKQVRQLK